MNTIQTPISGFHAHVYFENETRESAESFRAHIEQKLGSHLRYSGKLIDRPIGPHPVPMFEIDFLPKYFEIVVLFLMQNHGDHSVLIHPETGNDLKDHTTHALWLGKQLSLDLSIL
ncbi:MAG: DOPA 4,5-dioxygenase family protein [Bdellovibrionota bacterium]